MGKENQTNLERDLSNLRRHKALFFIIKTMQAMYGKVYPMS